MFTWVPIHQEAAERLRAFRDRQIELVQMLAEMRAAGLKTILIEDRDAAGNVFTLREMDPFTFMGNFNRGVTNENRVAMWRFLKDRWQMSSALPADFEGTPVLNNQAAWLMSYSDKRQPDHVATLWNLFENIMGGDTAMLDSALFDECLALRMVGPASLTMGFFWCRPDAWIALDRKNLEYASSLGVQGDPRDGRSYVAWMQEVREKAGGGPMEFSRQAHIWSLAQPGGNARVVSDPFLDTTNEGAQDGADPSSVVREDPPFIAAGSSQPPVELPEPYTFADALKDLFMSEPELRGIVALLKRKKNLILQGAPGTGKTFIARRLAWLLMGFKDRQRAPMVQFHQSLSYEDFIQGYRPAGKDGFTLQNGPFFTFCREALRRPGAPHVFIIDEINRGNLSKILGELMMLIEHDKRSPEHAMPLAYSASRDETFYVPDNVFIIGTMNTADRSLSMVDYALRRRFAFVQMQPGFGHPTFRRTLIGKGMSSVLCDQLTRAMQQLNAMITEDSANLGDGYRIGHSFFVPPAPVADAGAWLADVYAHEIGPLIEEYWADDAPRLEKARGLLRL